MPWCPHRATVTTITAGLAREVCETCGHVSLRYVENAVQLFSTRPRSFVPPPVPKPAKKESGACLHCRQQAVFNIPGGEVCQEHAWQAAARIDWDTAEIWVPIRIDRSNA